MADITFGSNGLALFSTKYHGEVTLSKWKWDQICKEPERFYYKYNWEKVPTTLVAPDYVRHHKIISTQFMYYKKFDTFMVTDKVEGPLPCKFMAVVVDTATQCVCTVYPTDRPKLGKEYKGEGS